MTLQRQVGFWLLALVGFLLFLWLFRSVLLPFIMGMALAYVLDPVADRLERIGMNRLWATITILIVALVVFVIALLFAIPVLINQVSEFLQHVPGYVRQLRELAGRLFASRIGEFFGLGAGGETAPDGFVMKGVEWLGSMAGSLLAGGRAVINVASLFVVTPVVAFYLLYDWDRIVALIDDALPRDHAPTVRRLAREIDSALAGFVRGQGLVCLILGTFYAVGLTLVGLNSGLLIGVIAGVISFIPYVGTIVGFLLAVAVAIVQFWPDALWIVVVAGIFVAGQVVEGNLLQPKLVGGSVGVHPVWLIFALFAFGSLFGFVGLLMAVPATAAIGVLARFAMAQYKQSAIYAGVGVRAPDDDD